MTADKKICNRCRQDRPVSDFHVYKRGEYLDQRRHVCKSCCNNDTLKWRASKGSTRREFVQNTARLRSIVRYLQDHYGGVAQMCAATGISKSFYQRVIRDLKPKVEKRSAMLVLEQAQKVAEARAVVRSDRRQSR